MIGNVGTSELFNYTAIGDTVNTANRLEGAAKPGQTLINEAAYNLVKKQVIVDKLEPIKVKGRTERIPIYDLRGIVKE